jgi:amidophosphoribosyltransferase
MKIQHECGVFGVYGRGLDVARLTFFGLFALQHRGQESAGIAVSDGEEIFIQKDMGLVSGIFDEQVLSLLRGHIAIGHTRYSTTGSSVIRNAQPILVSDDDLSMALGHNGNLINAAELRQKLTEQGVRFEATTDSEVIAQLIHREMAYGAPLEEALRTVAEKLQGAYSLVLLTERELVGLRDPLGLHPLCLGSLNGQGYVIASETCALNVVGAQFIQEIEPGEAVIVDEEGWRTVPLVESRRKAMCIFEFLYFARPDSDIYGKSLHAARRRMGQQLAVEHPVEADVVIPVPDSGTPAAIGYAEASHIPFGEGLMKSRYIQRTFIQPDPRQRELGVRLKLTPLRENLAGRRVVMVDDSIVRGTTTRNIVGLLFDAGAREVHVRICAPPIRYPCFYGIDMATRGELIASNKTVEEVRQHIGATTLGYLSPAGLEKAIGISRKHFCWACMNGKYPLAIPPDLKDAKFILEKTAPPPEEILAQPRPQRRRRPGR